MSVSKPLRRSCSEQTSHANRQKRTSSIDLRIILFLPSLKHIQAGWGAGTAATSRSGVQQATVAIVSEAAPSLTRPRRSHRSHKLGIPVGKEDGVPMGFDSPMEISEGTQVAVVERCAARHMVG